MKDDGAKNFDLQALGFTAPAPVDIEAQARVIEAILFSSSTPIDEGELQKRLLPETSLNEILARLCENYKGRGVILTRVGCGWAFRTAPDLAGVLQMNITVNRRLSRAAVETMSIIAYHQPITRAEVEEIRGVALSRGTLDTLLEAGWVQPRGRRKVPGRPLQWGTTDAFLDHFGLDSLAALPGIDDLKAAGLLDRRQGLTSIAMPELEEEDDGYDGRIGGQENLFPLDSERADPDVYYASDTGSSTTDDLP
jgi:segregation and condensation protein B